jgi:hypothetical protein
MTGVSSFNKRAIFIMYDVRRLTYDVETACDIWRLMCDVIISKVFLMTKQSSSNPLPFLLSLGSFREDVFIKL